MTYLQSDPTDKGKSQDSEQMSLNKLCMPSFYSLARSFPDYVATCIYQVEYSRVFTVFSLDDESSYEFRAHTHKENLWNWKPLILE